MLDVLQRANDLISGLPPIAIVGGLVVLVLAIVGIARMIKGPKSRLTAFSSETGSVLVSRKALQDLIRQTCRKDRRVEAARPVVKIEGKKVNTSVTLRLSSPDNLKATTERLQTRISELLQRSLSFDQIGPIEIMVTSFGKQDVDEPPVDESELPEEPDRMLNLNAPRAAAHEEADSTPEEPPADTPDSRK